MILKKVNREHYKQAFEVPVLTFLKEFVLRYYKEDKLTLREANLIENILQDDFSKIIYCDTDNFFGESSLKLMPNTYDNENDEVLFYYVLDGIVKNNGFIDALDTLMDVFETETDHETCMSFRNDCLKLEHLFGKLENYVREDFEEMIKSEEIEFE